MERQQRFDRPDRGRQRLLRAGGRRVLPDRRVRGLRIDPGHDRRSLLHRHRRARLLRGRRLGSSPRSSLGRDVSRKTCPRTAATAGRSTSATASPTCRARSPSTRRSRRSSTTASRPAARRRPIVPRRSRSRAPDGDLHREGDRRRRPQRSSDAATLVGGHYNCTAGGISLFLDVLPTDSFCKHVHYIAAKNVTRGLRARRVLPQRHGHARPDGLVHRQGARGAGGRAAACR